MQILCCHIAALGVASIFYTWRSYCAEMLGRHRLLRDRVAYMLWVAADLGEGACVASCQETATAGV
jgi:hypothetical protein